MRPGHNRVWIRLLLLSVLALPAADARAGLRDQLALLSATMGSDLPLDHFVSYGIRPSRGSEKFTKFGPVRLDDQFGSSKYEVTKSFALLVPADKNGEGLSDPLTHLHEYKVKRSKETAGFEKRVGLRIINQCNDLSVEAKKPLTVLVPANKEDPLNPALDDPVNPPDPNAHDVDHFLCYQAKLTRGHKLPKGTQAVFSDQFQTRRYDLKKVSKLCNPVAKSADPNDPPRLLSGSSKGQLKAIESAEIRNAAAHLVCYRAKLATKEIPQLGCGCDTGVDPSCRGTKLDPKQEKSTKVLGVNVNHQFGPEVLDVMKLREVCIPTEKYEPSAGSLLALSYNVAGLPMGLSGSEPAINTPLISPLLNGYDLVLVQESWETPDPNPLDPLRVYHELLVADANHPFKSIPAPLPLGMDPRRPSALVSDGLNRMSEFPFTPVIRQLWSDCHESSADCLSLKGFSVARTTLAPGVVVDIYNLHMEAGGDPEDEALRDAAVTQMSTFMASFSQERAIIVGGDFNLHSDEEPDSTQFQRLLQEAGLTDVCVALACPEPGRIDKFLFRSSDFIRITPTSWNFEVDVFKRGDGEPLSDHDALAVRFEWTADVRAE